MSRSVRALRAAVVALLVVTLAGCGGTGRRAAPSDVPAVMAAAGDSITRAFNVGGCCAWSDAPEYSWAAGDDRKVNSHFGRLLRLNPHARMFNVAKTGAKMADLERQLRAAASYGADYVTILMGSNDLLGILSRTKNGCAVDPAGMTSVSAFRAQFRRALTAFTTAQPGARIMVASIPDITRLWSIFRQDQAVLDVWDRNGGCEHMLGDPRTDEAVRAASTRLAAYNRALASTCARFERCRWDGGATFRFPFERADFSEIDFFHPNARGQQRLAEVTWRSGYWG